MQEGKQFQGLTNSSIDHRHVLVDYLQIIYIGAMNVVSKHKRYNYVANYYTYVSHTVKNVVYYLTLYMLMKCISVVSYAS